MDKPNIYLKSHFLYGSEFEYKKGILVIEDGIIKGFTNEDIKNYIKYDGVIMPPLINAHTHIGDNIIKDIGINKTLDELVKPPNGLKHKFLNTCDDKHLIHGMLDGLHELRNNGIKYFCDFRENGLRGINIFKESYELFKKSIAQDIGNTEHIGDTKNIKKNIKNIKNSDITPKPIILGRPKSNDKELKKEIRDILKNSDGIGLSGCNEYSDKDLKFIRNNDYKIFSIHANEHKGSVEYSKETYGKTEIERIIDLKLNPNFIIHATHATSHEAELLYEYNIPVVVCPRANASFNVGLPNIPMLLKNKVLAGLGTDNFMANSPSLFKEMDFIYKLYHIDPKEILKFATINNAKILGLKDIGLIDEGYKATFTFIKKSHSIKYSKNIVASIITRCENGDIKIIKMT
ncbi:amidohydrolase family protein [Methanothermococcus okinawensis]|uniref:Amidohydrolase n=1 Tax=Methanothermococcus okinawensis (strain DSM 14208 / JCM 11175 / IH1) TaxID=647113 RepID=F8AMN6_METOI|nr:amidohydrolase family protein [Methanothermococcus okinawensis]AEH06867.1 amidohydrolase [Methanothermococcus okinawensis IH1]